MCDLLDNGISQRKKYNLPNLFFGLAVFFGLFLVFLEPPFVCPDEAAHYWNICRISRGNVFVDVQEGAVGSWLTAEEIDYYYRNGWAYNEFGSDVRFDFRKMCELMGRMPSTEMSFLPNTFSCINPIPYLLPSFVVAVVRFFLGGVNAYEILLISKIANLFFYAAIIRFALLKTKAFRHTMFLLALMPMAIFQGASTSYDSPLIAISFLLFAYATKILLAPEDYRITKEDIIVISLACGLLCGCKIAYAPLILIFLSVSIVKFGGWKKWGVCVGAVAGACVLLYLIPNVIIAVITRGIEEPLSEAYSIQREYFRANFWQFPKIVFNTFDAFGSFWLESFIGKLGWLDTPFPKPFLFLFFVISTLNALIDACSIKEIRWKTRVFSLVGVLIFLIGSLYTMYLEWNPVLGIVGGDIINGMQGRYFIPVALFVLIAISNPLLHRVPCKEKIEEIRESVVPMTAVASLCLTVLLIFVRYWA
ncbi:MAG: DUF2142 domain-containing protein [Clostridia bacterium]|nr:DUF2142 domain-containing protein [Clostridia bacterium]